MASLLGSATKLPRLAALFVLAGCAYLHDRAADLGDVVTAEVGTGVGLHAEVKATDAASVGIGAARLESWRYGERRPRAIPDADAGLPFSLAAWPSAVAAGRLDRVAAFDLDGRALAEDRVTRQLDVEAGVTLGVVGVRLGVRLGEIVDFLAGFVGLDPADDDSGDADERAYRDEIQRRGRWFGGDPHVHVTPPDSPGHVSATLEDTISQARRRGVEWIVLTPHVWLPRGDFIIVPSDSPLPSFTEEADQLREGGPLVVDGFEWTARGRGHVGVAFTRNGSAIDEASFEGLLDDARKRGAFLTVNHPFVHPLELPPFGRIARLDIGWKGPTDDLASFDALEAYNLLWDLGERLCLVAPDERALAKTWREADRIVTTRHRRLVVTGSADNHGSWLLPLTWVFAPEPLTRDSLHEALVAGRACVVNDEASTFRARGDRGDATWRGIGERADADREVELRWRGRAELYVDGTSLGVHSSGWRLRLEEPGSFHAARIVARGGYSNYIYINGP